MFYVKIIYTRLIKKINLLNDVYWSVKVTNWDIKRLTYLLHNSYLTPKLTPI